MLCCYGLAFGGSRFSIAVIIILLNTLAYKCSLYILRAIWTLFITVVSSQPELAVQVKSWTLDLYSLFSHPLNRRGWGSSDEDNGSHRAEVSYERLPLRLFISLVHFPTLQWLPVSLTPLHPSTSSTPPLLSWLQLILSIQVSTYRVLLFKVSYLLLKISPQRMRNRIMPLNLTDSMKRRRIFIWSWTDTQMLRLRCEKYRIFIIIATNSCLCQRYPDLPFAHLISKKSQKEFEKRYKNEHRLRVRMHMMSMSKKVKNMVRILWNDFSTQAKTHRMPNQPGLRPY